MQAGRAEAHTGHSHSANRAQSVGSRQVPKPGPPRQAAILTVQRQLEQGSWELTGSPLLCSRPFRKQPAGGGCSARDDGPPRDRHWPPSAALSSLETLSHSRLTVTHRAAGARKGPGRVWTQAGTLPLAALNAALLARVGRGETPEFSQEREYGIRLPAVHALVFLWNEMYPSRSVG